jgi:hypothetical protein
MTFGRCSPPGVARGLPGGVSPATIATYTSAIERLADFVEAHGTPTCVGAIRREHVEAFIAGLLQ